ncbi:MAG: hypothetical protein NW226_05605 [Microscillaceae bacterium]|nr:hypothetical protein [Microscillaceae bacterium]
MQQFTRILIAACAGFFILVVFMASSQGWWHYTFRNSSVMKQNQQFNKEYRQYYTHQGSYHPQGLHHRSTRNFRSGTRGGWGK